MKRSIKNLQRNRETNKLYLIVKKYLDHYGIRVARWMPYDTPDAQVQYLADMDEYRVWIPFPVDAFSFYICMHEVGHCVKGHRRYAYLQEIAAEQYSIRKCKQHGLYDPAFLKEAQTYVRTAAAEDIVFRGLDPAKINKVHLRWLKRNPAGLYKDAMKLSRSFRKEKADGTAHVRTLFM